MRAAVLQYQASGTAGETLKIIEPLIADAAADGADFICLPECASFIAANRKRLFEIAEDEANSPTLDKLCAFAQHHAVYLNIGSVLMRQPGAEKCVNRGYIVTPEGKCAVHYDKIHMFSADVGDGKSYREEKHFHPGNKLVLYGAPFGKIGLSICYDVRFGYLYHKLAHKGADIITVPAAFTRVTGQAHWHTLLRARAIETGCFILASAQYGTHADGRKTYGHALIVNPWGEVIADAGTMAAGFVSADLNLQEISAARQAVPSLQHQRAEDI